MPPTSRGQRLARALLLLVLPAAAAAADGPPAVLVTLKPLHSLVAAVMADVGRPRLLLQGGESPHAYAMRPSDARALHGARLVVWTGAALETFLARPLAAAGADTRVLEVLALPGIERLPARRGGTWEPAGAPDPGAGASGAIDPHLWLDPRNARVVVAAVAGVLAGLDPAHRDRYAANASRTDARLAALDAELEAALAPVREVPFLVYHDAFQYLEHRYGLSAVGAVTGDAQVGPGARRLTLLRERVREAHVRCLFREPQFAPALAATVLEGQPVRTAVLDPLGTDLPAGPEAYFLLMRRMAQSLTGCLGRP